jgi:hypothetical protein
VLAETGSTVRDTASRNTGGVAYRLKRARSSLAEGASSAGRLAGATFREVGSVEKGYTSTVLYFRLSKVTLTHDKQLRILKSELKVIWRAIHERPDDTCPSADVLLTQVQAFTFCSLKHPPVINRFGKPVRRRTVIRAPRGQHLFPTAVETDVEGSFALVLAILDFCHRTFCFVQWVTSAFSGSAAASRSSAVCANHYRKVKVTDSYAVIDVIQVSRVVCLVPAFPSTEYMWVNERALGTALRAYTETPLDKKVQ